MIMHPTVNGFANDAQCFFDMCPRKQWRYFAQSASPTSVAMKIFLQTLRVIGFSLYAIAALAFGYVLFISCHRFTVLERPVHVDDGYSFSQTFSVDRTEKYALGIKCQKTIPFEPLNDALVHDLVATFSLYDGETLVDDNRVSRRAGGAWAKDYIFRSFGSFEAKPFHTYRVDVRFTKSLPVLEPTHPVAIIQIVPWDASDAYIAADILTILALLLVLVGTILRLPHHYWLRNQQRVAANQGLAGSV